MEGLDSCGSCSCGEYLNAEEGGAERSTGAAGLGLIFSLETGSGISRNVDFYVQNSHTYVCLLIHCLSGTQETTRKWNIQATLPRNLLLMWERAGHQPHRTARRSSPTLSYVQGARLGGFLEQVWEWSVAADPPGEAAKLEKRLSGEADLRSGKPCF